MKFDISKAKLLSYTDTGLLKPKTLLYYMGRDFFLAHFQPFGNTKTEKITPLQARQHYQGMKPLEKFPGMSINDG